MPVAIRGPASAAIAGQPLEVAPCGGPIVLPAGESELRTTAGADTGLDLDRLLLRSGPGGEPGPAGGLLVVDEPPADATPRLEVVERDSDRATIEVSGADPGTPFWISFGESHNTGWEASVNGSSLGEPELIDGFANGWRIDPEATSFDVNIRFTPQRRVDVALWLSLAGAILCIVLAAVSRPRQMRPRFDEVPAAMSTYLTTTYHGTRPSTRTAVGLTVAMALAATLVLGLLAGLFIGALTALATRWERTRRWIVLIPPVALGAAAAYVIAWQIRYDVLPGFEWPSEFRRAHPVAWIAVLVLLADALVHRAWDRPRERRREADRR